MSYKAASNMRKCKTRGCHIKVKAPQLYCDRCIEAKGVIRSLGPRDHSEEVKHECHHRLRETL